MYQQMLLVENDLVNCQAICSCMQSENVGTHCVKSLADAVEAVLEREYCLAIMAIQPAEAKEVEMLRMVRHSQKMPIIALTNQLTANDRIALFQAGANACTEKPIDLAVFTAQASSLIHL